MSPIPMRSSPPAFYSRSHEHFLLGVHELLLGVHEHPFPRFSPAAWPPARHGGSIGERKPWRCRRHLYQRPKYVVRPRNVPKRCTSAITAKDGVRYLPRLACRSLTVRREERGRKIRRGTVTLISRLTGGVGIGIRLHRPAIEMPRRVAEQRNHYC